MLDLRRAFKAVCCLLFVSLLPGEALPQSAERAAIEGRVIDATGAVLVGAEVTLQSRERGFEMRATSDERGNFTFNPLSPGSYSLTVKLQGFATARMEEFRLASYQRLEASVVLKVGAPETVVSISANSSPIDTASPAIHEQLPQTALQEMPVMTGTTSRSVLPQLPLLFPGASFTSFNGRGDTWGLRLSINGSPVGGVGFTFDGIDNSFLLGNAGGSVTTGPNPDALELLSVQSQNYQAESGGHQADVHMHTRSGTNQFHGQARALRLDPSLRARDFFETTKAAEYKTNAAGFQLSGPVVLRQLYDGHNRTFWFFDMEWTRSHFQGAASRVFPSDAERAGDFSGLPPALQPVDPATGKPFPEGRLPATRILPQSRFYIDEFIPRNPSGGQTTIIGESRASGCQFTARLDHRLRSSDTFSASLFLYRNQEIYHANTTIGTTSEYPERGHNLSVQYARGISALMSNVFTFGHTGWNLPWMQNGKFQDIDLTRQGYNIHNVSAGPHGYPAVYMMNTGAFDPSGYSQSQYMNTFQWKDDLALLRSAHSWKFGGDLRWSRGEVFDSYSGVPNFTYSASNYSGSRNDLADLLLGIPASYGQGSDSDTHPRRVLTSLYAQDGFRLHSTLMLNLGLRYELNSELITRDGRNGAFRPESKSRVFPNAPIGVLFNGDFDPLRGERMGSALTSSQLKKFAPRTGLAWSPGFSKAPFAWLFGGPGNSSIRAGFGVYHIVGLTNPVGNTANLPPWFLSAYLDSSSMNISGGNMANPWGSGRDPFSGTLTQRDFYLPLQGVPYVEPGLRDPYQYQWTLSIQRRLPGEVSLELAYLGNRTLHLLRGFEANPARVTAGANVTNAESRRTYREFGKVNGYASDGTSIYNGLQLTVSRRFSRRLLFNSHYVWSKTLDNAGGIGASALVQREATPWGRANSDRTRNFAGYWVLELPGPGHSAWLRQALSGWRLSGNVQVRSGIPLNIRNPWDSTLQGFAANMPDIIGPFVKLDPRIIRTFTLPNGRIATGNFFFDPTVFQIVRPATPQAARIGNLGRNVFTGLGTANVDLSLLKEFRLSERRRLEARIDSTNVLNHAQFVANQSTAGVNGNLFGRVTSTSGPRRIQFQLRFSF